MAGLVSSSSRGRGISGRRLSQNHVYARDGGHVSSYDDHRHPNPRHRPPHHLPHLPLPPPRGEGPVRGSLRDQVAPHLSQR